MALGGVGLVVFAVVGRIVVGIGVDAQHGEVSGVAGPHPVVGVATEFANAFRRIAYEADVGVVAVHKEVELVAVVKALDLWAEVGADGLFFFFDLTDDSLDGGLAIAVVHV